MMSSDKNEAEVTETLLTRDELLVFNTMCFLQEHLDSPEISAYLAVFERDDAAREKFMARLVTEADKGFQRVFTVPEEEEHH